jgi:hypothetical protein
MPGTEDLRQQILNILELDPEASIVELVRNCGYCGADIGHLHPNAEYCSSAHAKRAARRAGLEERNCSECGRPIDHTANLARKVCSVGCSRDRELRLQRERRANEHGNGHDETDPRAAPARPDVAGGRLGDHPDPSRAGDGAARRAAGVD